MTALLCGLAIIALPALAWLLVPRVEKAIGGPLTDPEHFADRAAGTYLGRLWNVTRACVAIGFTVAALALLWFLALLYLVSFVMQLLG